MSVPFIDHVSIWVGATKVHLACNLFHELGWVLDKNRNPSWDSGMAKFMYHPEGGPYLQLTSELDQTAGSPGSAAHVAFKCDVAETLRRIRDWATSMESDLVVEDLGGGKFMLQLPEIFNCLAFELVPE